MLSYLMSFFNNNESFLYHNYMKYGTKAYAFALHLHLHCKKKYWNRQFSCSNYFQRKIQGYFSLLKIMVTLVIIIGQQTNIFVKRTRWGPYSANYNIRQRPEKWKKMLAKKIQKPYMMNKKMVSYMVME